MAEANTNPQNELEMSEQMQVRIDKMHKIEEAGLLPFGHKFAWTHHAQDVADQFDAFE